MLAAASATRDSGRSSLRLVDQPKNVATSTARIDPITSAVSEGPQRAFGLVERERLEVRRVVGADPDTDRQVRVAVLVGESLRTRAALVE